MSTNKIHFCGKIREILCGTLQNTNQQASPSLKHAYIILTPLKPHFYIVKLGFTRVKLFFLFLLKNLDCGYSSELPRQGGSNEYLQSMF